MVIGAFLKTLGLSLIVWAGVVLAARAAEVVAPAVVTASDGAADAVAISVTAGVEATAGLASPDEGAASVVAPAPLPQGWPDRLQRRLSRWVLRRADDVDWHLEKLFLKDVDERSHVFNRYFGDRTIAVDERAGSRLRLSATVRIVDRETVDFAGRYDVRLKLPRMRNRVELIVDNIQEDANESKLPASTLAERERSARLRVVLVERWRGKIAVDAGLRFDPEPEPRLRLSGNLSYRLGAWLAEGKQSLIYDAGDGFGERTQLRFERLLGERLVTSLDNEAVWSETSEGVEFTSTWRLGRNTSKRTSVGVATGIAWHTLPEAVVDNYLLRLPLRVALYRDWIDLLVEPGVNFPVELDYESVPLITLRISFNFGDLR